MNVNMTQYNKAANEKSVLSIILFIVYFSIAQSHFIERVSYFVMIFDLCCAFASLRNNARVLYPTCFFFLHSLIADNGTYFAQAVPHGRKHKSR